MLKIKDGVDLKELENFGFKYVENKHPMGDFSYCVKEIGGNIILSVIERGKLMLADVNSAESNMTYMYSDGLDVIYDLIQAGLIEKVKK